MFEFKLEIENIDIQNIDENIKNIFSNKKNVKVHFLNEEEIKIYTFEYQDIIKNLETQISAHIYLSQKKNALQKIELDADNKELSDQDISNYFYSELYRELTLNIIRKEQKKYTIRIYYFVLHDTGISGEYTVNWEYKIKFKSLLNEKQKNTIAERIICFDCEVDAISLSHARSKAYNIVKDFAAYLAALLNIGFSPYMGKFGHFINKEIQDNQVCFMENFQRQGFIDQELRLIVSDNLNGLHHIEDYLPYQPSTYFSYSINEGFETNGGYIENNDEELNSNLEKTFRSLTITKAKGNTEYCESIDDDGQYKLTVLVPKQIRKYFKGIQNLDEMTRRYFRNCCRLNNIALTCGMNEITLMISYQVAAIECLAKSEKLNFSKFMKKYLDDEFDEKFCDYLYSIRSGHFHSGEMFFLEYDLNLDITLDFNFINLRDKRVKANYFLRKAFVKWIENNIVKEEI